jgi:hypothetical protein
VTKPKTPWCCQKCSGLGKIIPRATPRSKICAWCADELKNAGQKWCTTGRHGAPLADWTPNNAMCRACQKAYNAVYRADEAHHEKAIAASRAYWQAHHAEAIAASRAYYQEKRAELLEKKRVYYQEKRELLKAKAKAHRPHIPAWSRAKMRARQRAKHQIYYHAHKLNQRRRWLESLRGAP